jgi:hypothetical protein
VYDDLTLNSINGWLKDSNKKQDDIIQAIESNDNRDLIDAINENFAELIRAQRSTRDETSWNIWFGIVVYVGIKVAEHWDVIHAWLVRVAS